MVCLYKIQHINDHEFEEIMTDMIDNIILDYDKYLIMGDVNFNMLNEHQSTNSVSQICDLFDLRNIITQPTCFKNPRGTLIDVILSPNCKCIQTQGVVATGLSDYHRMIYVVTKNHAPVPQRKQVTYRSFKSLNEREYINDLETAPFHVGEIFNDVDDQYFYFSKMFSDITNEHIPLKTRNVKPNPPPFMNSTYRKSIMNKARLQHRKENFPNNTNWENFRVQRNLTTKLKRKSVRTYFHERCGDDGKSDSKTFYSTLCPFYSNKGGKSSGNIQLLENDTLVTRPTDVANVMNPYYVNITSSIGEPVTKDILELDDDDFIAHSQEKFKDHPSVKKILEKHPQPSNFKFKEVSPDSVQSIISHLDPHKATGYDKIPPKLLKIAAPAITNPITSIVNASIQTSKFPSECKKAEVGPVHKKDELLFKKNYRPVSILTSISKVLEKCFNTQMNDFNKQVLSNLISAYRAGYSCQSSLIKLCEEMRHAMDHSEKAAMILMDLSKAFDCLPHDLVVAKLTAYGMSPSAIKLITNYLRHRQQRVKIGSEVSDWMTILKGVPQGSILGPCIFNLFLNDFMYILKKSSPVNYADDNTLCASGKTLASAIENVKQDTESAIDWFDENQMQANPVKFQFMHTSDEEKVVFECRDVTIEAEKSVKLLGINIDYKLKFTQHVSDVIRKCGFQLNTLRRHSKLLNTNTKLKIFYSFIQANLNYCPLIWINRNRTDLNRIEKVQKRALRIVFNDKSSDYGQLLNRAKTCSIETRWKRQLVAEVYKAVNGLAPSYISDMFRQKTVDYDLRARKLITQPRFYTQTHGYHSLRNEGTRLWAMLPNCCKEAKDIYTFKRMIVDYIN